MKLVLFDLDGTLTTKDTLWSFLRFYSGTSSLIFRGIRAAPTLTAYVLGLTSAERAKSTLLSAILKGESKATIEGKAREFCEKILPELLNENLMVELKQYLKSGEKVCIVTASCSAWVAPFCIELGIDLIATELDFQNGIFSGKFMTPNCKGEEKVRRIRLQYNLEKFSSVIAYGNLPDDQPMLNLAHIKRNI